MLKNRKDFLQKLKRGKIGKRVQKDLEAKFTMRPEIAPQTTKIAGRSKDREFKREANLSQKRHSALLATKSQKKEAARKQIRE